MRAILWAAIFLNAACSDISASDDIVCSGDVYRASSVVSELYRIDNHVRREVAAQDLFSIMNGQKERCPSWPESKDEKVVYLIVLRFLGTASLEYRDFALNESKHLFFDSSRAVVSEALRIWGAVGDGRHMRQILSISTSDRIFLEEREQAIALFSARGISPD